MKINNTLYLATLLFFAVLAKNIFISTYLPVFEFPDEQAHFGQVAFQVEVNAPINHGISGKDLNLEIYELERIMGTLRNEHGINKNTYNPDYLVPYTTNDTGYHEDFLQNLPDSFRLNFVKQESSHYPPAYYALLSIGYRLFYESGILERVFAVRLISSAIGALMVFPAILVSKQLFKNSTNAWLLAVALSFQPMFNFLSAAPNNDIESNVISLLIISSTLSLLKKDSLKKTAIAGTFIGLGLVVKQLAIPVAISAAIVVILKLITSPARKMYKKLGLFIAVVLAISGWKYLPLFFQTGQIRYLPQTSTTSQVGNVQLHDYFLSALKKYYRESFVWYWGVYKWLGVTIPFWVVRLAKVIIIISGLGLVKTFISGPSKTKLQVSTLIFLSLFIVVFLTWWDYRLVLSTGIPYGIQGRYFFPTIGAHFGLITIGLTALTKRYKTQVLVIWAFLNMLFNLVFINKIIGSYYPADSLADLVRIASQYKPWFAKGNFLTTTASLHFIFQLVLLILLAKIFFTKNYEKK